MVAEVRGYDKSTPINSVKILLINMQHDVIFYSRNLSFLDLSLVQIIKTTCENVIRNSFNWTYLKILYITYPIYWLQHTHFWIDKINIGKQIIGRECKKCRYRTYLVLQSEVFSVLLSFFSRYSANFFRCSWNILLSHFMMTWLFRTVSQSAFC